jgi:hypothetical protein
MLIATVCLCVFAGLLYAFEKQIKALTMSGQLMLIAVLASLITILAGAILKRQP